MGTIVFFIYHVCFFVIRSRFNCRIPNDLATKANKESYVRTDLTIPTHLVTCTYIILRQMSFERYFSGLCEIRSVDIDEEQMYLSFII